MKHFLYIIGCSALLTGCNLYSHYERPESATKDIDKLYRDTTEAYATVPADTANFGNTPWQQVFTDPQLQALIQKALEQNTDLRSADLLIEQAKAGLKVARLAYYPTLAFNPQGTVSSWDFGKATKTYSFPLSASWQIGHIGQLRNAKKQSETQLQLSREAKQATRTAIIAAVANMYYTLQMLDEQLRTTKETVNIWRENVRTMELMKTAAMTTEAAVGQSRANLLQLEASVPALESNIRQTENALCALLHETPHPISRGVFNADGFPSSFSTGVPAQLLSNRPDVRAKEMQLANAFYTVNAARAAFYPSLTISGQGAWTNNAGAIINPGKILASAVASLTQPIFANGMLRANLKVSKLQLEDAQLQFEQALLNAGQEVSNALMQYQSATAQEATMQQQVATLTHTLEQTQLLFKHTNNTSYLQVLTAQQSLIQAQLSLISYKFDKVQAAICLYQALGGGREA